MDKKALIVVDLQVDFYRKEILVIQESNDIIPIINAILPIFPIKIKLQNQQRNKDGIKRSIHHIPETKGIKFYPELNDRLFTAIIRITADENNSDTYTVFESAGIKGLLRSLEVENVYICGLVLDHYVKAIAIDSAKAGFKTCVILKATGIIDKQREDSIYTEMSQAGIQLIDDIEEIFKLRNFQ